MSRSHQWKTIIDMKGSRRSWAENHAVQFQSLKLTLNLGTSSMSFYGNINPNPFRPNPRRREKINLNFYFHISLRCLKGFYESL